MNLDAALELSAYGGFAWLALREVRKLASAALDRKGHHESAEVFRDVQASLTRMSDEISLLREASGIATDRLRHLAESAVPELEEAQRRVRRRVEHVEQDLVSLRAELRRPNRYRTPATGVPVLLPDEPLTPEG